MSFNRTTMTKTLAVIACLTSSLALAQTVPGSITFNARLTDTGGAPVTGSHALNFGLYDTGSGGAALWTESVAGASFSTEGVAFVELGAVTPLTTTVLDGRKLYLEVSVDGTAMSPRLAIISVPYAIRASVASSALQVGSLTESAIQRRVTGTCNAGQAVRSIDASGGVQCESVSAGGGGDITDVTTTAGSGLQGGAATGAVSLGLATCATGQVLMSTGAGWNCSTAVGPAGMNGAPGTTGPAGPAGPALYGSFDFEDALTSTTAADSSGSGNTLTLNNLGTAIIATGHSGRGVLLDGISGFATNTAPAITVREAITVSAWVYRTAAGGAAQTIVAREGQFTLGIISGNAAAAFQTATGPGWAYFSGAAVPLTAWTHVAASYDGLSIRVYVNGVLSASYPYANGPLAQVAATVPLRVGNRSYVPAGTEFLTGRVDEIRISPSAPVVPARQIARAQGYLNDEMNNGLLTTRSLTLAKVSPTTGARITWSDNFRVIGNNTACRWEVTFNGLACTAPGGLVFDKYEGNTSSNRHDPSTFVGTCFANASGPLTGNVAIATRVGPTPGYGVTDCFTGWNNQLFSLEAEEVY